MAKPEDAPEPYASIIDEACEADADWFVEHPGETVYERPHVPGEFWPKEDELGRVVCVKVTQLMPGVRVREPQTEARR